MTLPREILPNEFYLLTRRCTQRMFLLRPDDETNNAFTYCLAEAAQRYEVDIILPSAMSNHHHTVLYDRHGNVSAFIEHFHRQLAKCQNALRGRWENCWSNEPASIVRLVGVEAVIESVVYAATNPVKDGLVDRVDHWPGVNGWCALRNGRTLRARRPRHYFSPRGRMPAHVELELQIPEQLGDRESFLDTVRARIAAFEAEHGAMRCKTGRRVLGRRAILSQRWSDAPKTEEPRRELNPTVAARCKWRRMEALLRRKEFIRAYRTARAAWLAGTPIPFPRGTYWLRRFAAVPVVGEPLARASG